MVGRVFGPIMVVWILIIGLTACGDRAAPLRAAAILPLRDRAVHPIQSMAFFVLGAVVLCVTGRGALCDRGLSGAKPIKITG